jgi:zinc transporter ZupT
MGIFTCLIFGVLAAWITRSSLTTAGTGGVKAVFTIGVLSGLLGLIGIVLGWGDLTSFNLYNIFLAILAALAMTIAWSKIQPEPKMAE